MQAGAITGYIDVAQVTLYVFWIFFFGLVFWLRREDKREGYPLVTEKPGERVGFFPPLPPSKTYLLPHGGTVTTPREDQQPEPSYSAQPLAAWAGAPMAPLGNAMLSGSGPAASALRSDHPDQMYESGAPRVVPLRVANDHYIDPEGPDPRGMEVVGADGVVAGKIIDIWVDRVETTVRYLEMSLAAGPSVLIPGPLVQTNSEGQVIVVSIMGSQFADAPLLANPDVVTLREEDRIQAYFASGHLYADPDRTEPLL